MKQLTVARLRQMASSLELDLDAQELARGADCALDVSAAGVGGNGREQNRVFVDQG